MDQQSVEPYTAELGNIDKKTLRDLIGHPESVVNSGEVDPD